MSEEKSGFRKLVEMSDVMGREVLEGYLVIDKGRAENLLGCLEGGAKQIKELTAEIERLAAHNAMLLEKMQLLSLYVAHNGDDWVKREATEAINATSSDIQQWMDKHDAEVMMKLAGRLERSRNEWLGRTPENEIRRMADEVK